MSKESDLSDLFAKIVLSCSHNLAGKPIGTYCPCVLVKAFILEKKDGDGKGKVIIQSAQTNLTKGLYE